MHNPLSKNQGKLVRDNIPDIIRAEGRIPNVKQLSGDELIQALNNKLIEELEEYQAETDAERSVEELADLFEVVLSLAKNKGFDPKSFMAIVERKRYKNGGFDAGYFYEPDL